MLGGAAPVAIEPWETVSGVPAVGVPDASAVVVPVQVLTPETVVHATEQVLTSTCSDPARAPVAVTVPAKVLAAEPELVTST